jgi:hypothetical protein
MHVDATSSTTELAGFVGPGPDRLFVSLALPVGVPTGSVLIGSSLFAEGARNYRREVILARELAGRGIASLRYHYRGTGYSDGDPAALSFPSMCGDAADALSELRERCPGVPTACVGTRLGALAVASVARTEPSMPLLLWDPVPTADAFFQDATKARRAGGMVSDRRSDGTAQPEDDPWAGGSLDVLGYRLPLGLKESLRGVELADALGPAPRPIQIVTVVPGYEATPLAERVAELLRSSTSSPVAVDRIEGRLSWWTSRDSWDPDEDHPPTREVIARSADWLSDRLTGGPAR